MKRHAKTAVLGLVMTCAIAIPVFAIVGGELDTANEYANVGAIIATDHLTIPAPPTISSATLVHPQVVMTAGHTVAFMRKMIANNVVELSDLAVVFTPDAHDETGGEYRIAEMRIHEGFTDFDQKGGRDATSIDVGLLILTEAVAGITPVELPEAGFLDSLDLDRGTSESKPEFIAVGYGNTELTPPDGGLPVGERRVAISTFKSLRTSYLMLSQNFALGEGGFSRGDSGGPAFWELNNGSLVQVGILVNGDHAGATYGACLRTDLASVLEFVQAAIDYVEDVEE